MPERVLRVSELRLEDLADHGRELRVAYTITPLPPRGDGGTVASWPVVWTWAAEDDAGTAYREAGGAYGLSTDGTQTYGTLSLIPVPPDEARRLRVFMRPWFPWADPTERFRECVVEVELTHATQRSNGPGADTP